MFFFRAGVIAWHDGVRALPERSVEIRCRLEAGHRVFRKAVRDDGGDVRGLGDSLPARCNSSRSKATCHCQHDRRGETGDGERKGLTPPKRPLAYQPTTSQAFNAIIANAVPALAI